MSLITADDLTKTYRTEAIEVKALQGVSFAIKPGAFLAFVGPSGSGKTTLLNLIGCLDKPSSGSLQVAGVDVLKLGRRQAAEFRGQNIGFIFQSFNLIAVLTAFENVEYPLVMVQGLPLADRRDRVLKALQSVGMLEQKNQMPDQLSGGQKQRVAIARAMRPISLRACAGLSSTDARFALPPRNALLTVPRDRPAKSPIARVF